MKLGDSRSIDSVEALGIITEEDPFVCPLVGESVDVGF